MEKKVDTLRRADRHCDIEGLPPASPAALALDTQLVAGTIHPDDAVRLLVKHHSRPALRARLRSRVPAVLVTAGGTAYLSAQALAESAAVLL